MNALPTHNPITLLAKDGEDLAVVAGLVQDSLFPIADIKFDKVAKTFVVVLNRFCWENTHDKPPYNRTHCILQLSNITQLSTQDIDTSEDRMYSLLSIIPVHNNNDMYVYLTMAGGGVMRLKCSDINVVLKDVGEAWHTDSRPIHENADLN